MTVEKALIQEICLQNPTWDFSILCVVSPADESNHIEYLEINEIVMTSCLLELECWVTR